MKSIILFFLLGLSFSYNANKAVSFARTYCKNYHNSYKNYRDTYGDNSNFVSQCLIAGGQDLNGCIGLDGYGCIYLPNNLKSCLTLKGWKSQKGMPNEFKAGYPFFNGRKGMIATSVEGNTIKYCSHTFDKCDATINADTSFYYYYLEY